MVGVASEHDPDSGRYPDDLPIAVDEDHGLPAPSVQPGPERQGGPPEPMSAWNRLGACRRLNSQRAPDEDPRSGRQVALFGHASSTQELLGVQHRLRRRLGDRLGYCFGQQEGQAQRLPLGLRWGNHRVGVGHHRQICVPTAASVASASLNPLAGVVGQFVLRLLVRQFSQLDRASAWTPRSFRRCFRRCAHRPPCPTRRTSTRHWGSSACLKRLELRHD